MRAYTREELLALTPAKYLKDGYCDRTGRPKAELQTEYATAASTQLFAAKLAPQELAFTYEALRQVLAARSGTPPDQFAQALAEAMEIVGRMIGQPNNPGLTQWITACATAIKTPADIEAFLAHFLAVLRQYSVIAASPRP